MNTRAEDHLPTLSPVDALAALRRTSPLVQCITNAVVTNFTANALLAVGAAPAMCDLPGEAGLFAGVANGVLVNLGTPTAEQRDAAREAVRAGTPWVLDPADGAPAGAARLIFITHAAREADVRATLHELRSLDSVTSVGSVLRVVGAE